MFLLMFRQTLFITTVDIILYISVHTCGKKTVLYVQLEFLFDTGNLSTSPFWEFDLTFNERLFKLMFSFCSTCSPHLPVSIIFLFPCFSVIYVSAVRTGEDGEARHPHSGPPPETGAAVRGIWEAADPETQQWCAEDSWEAVPGSMDRQAAEDQPWSSHSHQVRPYNYDSLSSKRNK